MHERRKRVAVVPGDDAAPEAVYPTLESMEPPIDWELLPDGESLARTASREERERLVREAADRSDAVLFGATSGKTGGIGKGNRIAAAGRAGDVQVPPSAETFHAAGGLVMPRGIDNHVHVTREILLRNDIFTR